MTTELVVITPALFMMVLLPIHVALWWHAKQAVDLAVEEALDAAQIDGASAADGLAAADAILSQTGNVDDLVVSVTINGDQVSVDITGRSRFRVVPGDWAVHGSAEGRVERFIGEQER
jgi:Flp pilus assembly protein TadG